MTKETTALVDGLTLGQDKVGGFSVRPDGFLGVRVVTLVIGVVNDYRRALASC